MDTSSSPVSPTNAEMLETALDVSSLLSSEDIDEGSVSQTGFMLAVATSFKCSCHREHSLMLCLRSWAVFLQLAIQVPTMLPISIEILNKGGEKETTVYLEKPEKNLFKAI